MLAVAAVMHSEPSPVFMLIPCLFLVLWILVVAYVGAVQGLDHFAVNPTRHNFKLMPQLLAFLWSTDDRRDLALLLPKLGNVQIGQFVRDLLRRAFFDRNVVLGGYDA